MKGEGIQAFLNLVNREEEQNKEIKKLLIGDMLKMFQLFSIAFTPTTQH